MLGLHLLLIFRNFKRFKISFFINLIGLSTGLACFLLIYLWVTDEVRVNTYHKNRDRFYQVMRNEPYGHTMRTEAFTPGPLAGAIATEIPDVEAATVVVPPLPAYRGIITAGNSTAFALPQFVGDDFFKLFTCHFVQGNKFLALPGKKSVCISDELSANLFHTTTASVIGRIVKFENDDLKGSYIISGVFRKQPSSTEDYDILFSYNLYKSIRPEIDDWSNGGPSTFVLVKKGTNIVQLDRHLTALLKRKRSSADETLFVQKYSERYLYGTYENGVPAGGRIFYVKLFSLVALLILGIACINFMNLSTAKASGRMKEAGIKKVMGAGRGALVLQYMIESLLLTTLSLFLALLMVELMLPQFNQITGKGLILHFDLQLIVVLLCITLFTGFFAGLYPALYLSAFNPAESLKGRLPDTALELLIRNGLVVFQFVISVVLIISVLVIYKQVQFIQTKDPGYEKDNIISFSRTGKLEGDYAAFVSELKKMPDVVNASYMYGRLAGGVSSRTGGFLWERQSNAERQTRFGYLDVDYDLIETLGLKIKEGRSFSRKFGADSTAIIFNETAIKAMGIKDPIGKRVMFYGKRQIIGIVKDFHFESLGQPVKPFFFKIDEEKGGNILVKIKAGKEHKAIAEIEKLYKEFNGYLPFEYKFLDQDYQEQYVSESRTAMLSSYFAGIAILISCLGLFGLASFMVERKAKEIAIRKTLGCDQLGILYLLSAHFVKIVGIAILIAFPLGYVLTRDWLDSFAYKTPLEWWYFAGAGIIAFLMTGIAIGSQLVKVSRINPALILKD